MVVDTSALIAILLGEPEAESLKAALSEAVEPSISAVSLFEARMVMTARLGPAGREALDAIIVELAITVLPFDAKHASVATDAFLAYGKGRHPAGLNFGDCCAYALAQATGRPLLFKGDDFAQTDIASALA